MLTPILVFESFNSFILPPHEFEIVYFYCRLIVKSINSVDFYPFYNFVLLSILFILFIFVHYVHFVSFLFIFVNLVHCIHFYPCLCPFSYILSFFVNSYWFCPFLSIPIDFVNSLQSSQIYGQLLSICSQLLLFVVHPILQSWRWIQLKKKHSPLGMIIGCYYFKLIDKSFCIIFSLQT